MQIKANTKRKVFPQSWENDEQFSVQHSGRSGCVEINKLYFHT